MPKHVHQTPFVIQPPADLVTQKPELRHLASQLAQMYVDGVVVSDEHLRIVGGALWSALDAEAAFEAAVTAAGMDILPVVIESDVPDVQVLPWETLFHPKHGFLGKNPAFTLSRQLSAGSKASRPLEKGPLKVLLFTSMPEGVNPLKVEEEQAQVQAALLPWILKGTVRLEMPDDGRFSTFQKQVADLTPHVLFLSGHGKFYGAPHEEKAHGEFIFETETGAPDPVDEDRIAAALVGSSVRLVVLSACESAKAASDALNHGLTRRLSQQGLPHVVGMRESVLDAAGIQFARALCDALAGRERVDTALQAARIAIQTPLADVTREAGGTAAAELSFGQWCLPMLISSGPHTPLIDWDFAPQAVDERNFKENLNTVSLPVRFVGRRAEMRRYQSDLRMGRLTRLLITGAGGQGKTALAGKLALDLQKQGARVFAWSARGENPWGDFEFDELQMALDPDRAERYSRFLSRPQSEEKRASFLLGLLTEQFERVALFLDNLETIQDPDSHALTEPTVAAWIRSALADQKLVLLATSRWDLPEWGDGARLPLTRVNYGDFLRLAENFRLKVERERLRQVFEALGGNARGLEFFAAAVRDKNPAEEAAFLDAIARTKADLQTNMAIAEIYAHLPAEAQTLLKRLPAYHEPVPEEGILKLGLDLFDPARAGVKPAPTPMDALLSVSLLEAQWNGDWEAWEYQPAPLVTDWLMENGKIDGSMEWLNAAADYHLYLLANERRTLAQAVTAHHALRRAERHPEADRLTLDRIVGPMTRKGFYAALLADWLPRICDSQDLQTRANGLNQTGKLHLHLGNFQTALPYLEQSLEICRQIGDRAGEGATLNNISQIFKAQGEYETALGYLKQSLDIFRQIGDRAGEATTLNNISAIYWAQGNAETALSYLEQSLPVFQQIGDKAKLCVTLFNMGHIHLQNKQVQEAVSAWVTAYLIAKQINEYQVLQALSSLAPQLGLPEGLEGWEELARRVQNGEKIEFEDGEKEEVSELEQVRRFVRGLVQAVREKSPEAGKYFEVVSKMAVDPKSPPPYQELGKVLQKVMSGIPSPDLSALPPEWAQIVREALA